MNCLFCDFVSGKRKKHLNKFPYVAIHQTKHTLSFLSTDSPGGKGSHLLVVPQFHFKDIQEVPKTILAELMGHVVLAAGVIQKRHKGCNVLLNNGKVAGQIVPHVHFHVIPRDKSDGIIIELWKRKKISLEKFMLLSSDLQKEFSRKV